MPILSLSFAGARQVHKAAEHPSQAGVTIQFEGFFPVVREGEQATRGSQRLDRYHRPTRWRQPAREVEKWCLEDGRSVKFSRAVSKSTWEFETWL